MRIVDEEEVEYLEVHLFDSGWPLNVDLTLALLGEPKSDGMGNRVIRLPNYRKSESPDSFVKFGTLREIKARFVLNDTLKIRASFPEPVHDT